MNGVKTECMSIARAKSYMPKTASQELDNVMTMANKNELLSKQSNSA